MTFKWVAIQKKDTEKIPWLTLNKSFLGMKPQNMSKLPKKNMCQHAFDNS